MPIDDVNKICLMEGCVDKFMQKSSLSGYKLYYTCVDYCTGFVEFDNYCDFTSCSLVRETDGSSVQLFNHTI